MTLSVLALFGQTGGEIGFAQDGSISEISRTVRNDGEGQVLESSISRFAETRERNDKDNDLLPVKMDSVNITKEDRVATKPFSEEKSSSNISGSDHPVEQGFVKNIEYYQLNDQDKKYVIRLVQEIDGLIVEEAISSDWKTPFGETENVKDVRIFQKEMKEEIQSWYKNLDAESKSSFAAQSATLSAILDEVKMLGYDEVLDAETLRRIKLYDLAVKIVTETLERTETNGRKTYLRARNQGKRTNFEYVFSQIEKRKKDLPAFDRRHETAVADEMSPEEDVFVIESLSNDQAKEDLQRDWMKRIELKAAIFSFLLGTGQEHPFLKEMFYGQKLGRYEILKRFYDETWEIRRRFMAVKDKPNHLRREEKEWIKIQEKLLAKVLQVSPSLSLTSSLADEGKKSPAFPLHK